MTIDVRDYDLATLYRFKLFFENTHWNNRPNCPITEIRNNHIYEGKRVEFPLIVLRRVATPIMYKDAQNSWATARTGDRRGRDISIAPDGRCTSADMTMVQTNYELRYMLEVFSFERDNFDELVVEVQENLYRYPYLTFENWKDQDLRMPDPQVSGMSTNITWESTEDNTDLESFDSQTPFYRATITFTLRAYIYRKYAALLLEEVISGYRILDYNKVTQQVVDSDYPDFPPEPDPPYPPPGPDPEPTGTKLTTDNVAVLNGIASIGLFQYSEAGEMKSYGTEVDGKYLKPISLNFTNGGDFSYTHYDKVNLTGKWKLLSVAKARTALQPCIVFAIKVADKFTDSDTEDSSTENTQDSNIQDSSDTQSDNTQSDNTDVGSSTDDSQTIIPDDSLNFGSMNPSQSDETEDSDSQLDNLQSEVEDTETEDTESPIKLGYFNLSHTDQELSLNILISDENQYIYYDSEKVYTLVSLRNYEDEELDIEGIELVNNEGKLAVNTHGVNLSACVLTYLENIGVRTTEILSI